MAKISFNINDLRQLAFGYVAPPYPLGSSAGSTTVKQLSGNFQFKANFAGAEYTMPTKMRIPKKNQAPDVGWYQLPNEPMMGFDLYKEVKTTRVNQQNKTGGRKGTVKEIINLEDWTIRLRGIMISLDETNYPEDQLSEINKLCQEGSVLDIQNYVCQLLGITRVVIMHLRLIDNEQLPVWAQAYEITMISDQDFDLELLENTNSQTVSANAITI